MNLKALNTYLTKNPKLLSRYINVSMTVIGAVLKPIDKVMKHALVVQGIDPNTVPGDRQRKALQAALDKDLNKLHEKDFDDDYDFSWAKKCLGVTNSKLVDLHLTKEAYKKLTNLNDADDKPEVMEILEVAGPPPRRETRLNPTDEEKQAKLEEESRPTKFVVHPDHKPMPQFDTESLKEALKKLRSFAESFENADDEEQQMIAQKGINEAGTELMEAQRQKHKYELAEETRKAYDPDLAAFPRTSPKPIETHGQKGLFKRVDKKKE